jgi:hypothetical protein
MTVEGSTEYLWRRPADWLAMPATATNQIDLLIPVWDTYSQYVGVDVSVSSGTLSIDWGDGTVDTGLSNGSHQHLYVYGTGLSGTDSSRGYRQALVQITPDSAANITQFAMLSTTPSSDPSYAQNLHVLEAQVNCPSVTSLQYMFKQCYFLERVNFIAIGAVTDISEAFRDSFYVQEVNWPSGSLAAVTDASGLFYGCVKLRRMEFPAGSLASLTDAAAMFYVCESLRRVDFPTGALAAVLTANDMFAGCNILEELVFPSGAFASATNMQSMLQGCRGLRRLVFATSSFASVTNNTDVLDTTRSLMDVEGVKFPESFNISYNQLSAAALDVIYTSLPTVSGKTIDVTANFGTTSDTPSIATGKGWTVSS